MTPTTPREHHACAVPLLRLGDVVTVRDWRTGEPYTPSPVEALRLNVGPGVDVRKVCAGCLAAAQGVRIETVAHSWYVRRQDWGRDVLRVEPPQDPH